MNRVAIRDAYGDALARLGESNGKVVVLEADVGSSSKSCVFGAAFPERYFNVGISELDMNAMAAGFACCGLIPFTNTFSVFMTLRGGDPINSMIGYDNLPVKLAGTYCGFSDSYDGASHHSICDIALLRAVPNIAIIAPGDAVETEKAVFAAAEHPGPVYLRLSRAPAPVLFEEDYAFELGKGVVLREGSDIALATTGTMVHAALEAAKTLEAEGLSAAVLHFPTVKPLDEALLLRYAGRTGAVLAIEEHSVCGGLGSAIAELCARELPTPMDFAGIEQYGESGDYEALLAKHGLDAPSIARKGKALIARK